MHKSQGIKANMINVAEYLLWMGWHPYIKDSVMMHFFYISAWRFMPLNSVSDCSCLMYRNHTIRMKLHTRLKKLQWIHILRLKQLSTAFQIWKDCFIFDYFLFKYEINILFYIIADTLRSLKSKMQMVFLVT